MCRRILPTALLAALILLAGCSISVATYVRPDGSGEFGIIYAFPEDTYSCREAQSQGFIPSDLVVVEDTLSDGSVTCTSSRSFGDLAGLRQILNQSDIVSIHALAIANYLFTYDIDVFPRAQDTGVYSMYWALKPPGELLSHNADRIEDGMLIWEMEVGERNSVQATSALPIPPTPTPAPLFSLPGDGTTPWPVILGAAAVVGVAVAFFRGRGSAGR